MRGSFAIATVMLFGGCDPSSDPDAVSSIAGTLQVEPNRFTLFESGQVRPLAMSLDGQHLYATNTPDGRLEIFRIRSNPNEPLEHVGSVQVGLEPVAVAVRSPGEVWVVNHLSDSVSIVEVSPPAAARVKRTLLVGDEPRDIVFAGPGGGRAFITTAHRGQHNPNDPQLTTPGVGRADVWVFDAANLGTSLGGTPLTIVTLFSDTPRALAVSPDGDTVYAAAFLSGNQTTVVHSLLVTNGGPDAPDGRGLPGPTTNFQLHEQPEGSLIVRHDGTHFVDELGRSWDDMIRFNLPDKDVFAIDATANPPEQLEGAGGFFRSVGTVIFNMVVNPVTGAVYVSNTEARNHVRFSGPGTFAGSTVQGNLHASRITVIDAAGVRPRHLNKHVNFGTCCTPAPNAESEASLAFPQGMAVSSDGEWLYVAAFGSSKVGVFATAELEDDTFVPSPDDHVELSGGGPTGLVLDDSRDRLYVLTRFDNGISVVDAATHEETHHVVMFNPEPPDIVDGRRFLYDARLTSGNGTNACGSCHVFGDFDGLAWDLGNPDDVALANPGPFVAQPFLAGADPSFQPLKGPMTTQSLRGMANHGPMHWRGDRTGANDVPFSEQPDTGLFDENAAFNKFNEAFVGLNGRVEPLPTADMQAFADFALQITYPPNPIRSLDNGLTPAQQRGRDHFFRPASTGLPSFELLSCADCHMLDPDANAEFGVARPGFFGSGGIGLVEGDDFFTPENGFDVHHFKTPHLRNLYQKVGMFGIPTLINSVPHSGTPHLGDQIRGFGYLHDGRSDTIFSFMLVVGFAQSFGPNGFPDGPEGDPLRRDVEQFLLAFDSNLAPIVGQQITLTASNSAIAGPRIDLLIERASTNSSTTPTPHSPINPHAPECELVVTTRIGPLELGFLYVESDGMFVSSVNGAPAWSDAGLRQLAVVFPTTYTCVPLGSGYRMALDADLDGCFNVTEVVSGSDERDPLTEPPGC